MHKMSKVLLRMLVSYIIQSQICTEKRQSDARMQTFMLIQSYIIKRV